MKSLRFGRAARGGMPAVLVQSLRYGAVVLVSLVLDIGAAWALIRGGAPDFAASAGGLTVAMVASFVAHGRWTFGGEGTGLRGLALYGGVCAVVWALRASFLAVAEPQLPGDGWLALARLFAAACVSFPVGFFLSRRLFSGSGDAPGR